MVKKQTIIIGAGPAGLSCALSLKEKEVLLLERALIGKKKLCGGLLREYPYSLLMDKLTEPQMWINPPQTELDIQVNGVPWFSEKLYNIQRGEFEASLKKQLSHKTEIIENARYTLTHVDKKFKISMRDGREYISDYLVIADGVNSRFRRKLTTVKPDKILTRQLTVRGRIDKSIFILNKEIISDYYIWIIPKGDTWVMGSKHCDEFTAILDTLLKRFSKGEPEILSDQYAWLTCHTNSKALIYGKDNALLVGEAAGFVTPSLGEGFTGAIESGIRAGEILSQDKPDISEYRSYVEMKKRETEKDLLFARSVYS